MDKPYPGFSGVFAFPTRSLSDVWLRSGGRMGWLTPPPLDPPMYFDFLPIDKTTIMLFVVGRGKMQVWEESATYSKKWVRWDPQWKEKKELQMKADFAEPFFVYQVDSAYYFVTVSGKLYRSKLSKDFTKPTKEGSKVVPLWTDAERPSALSLRTPLPRRLSSSRNRPKRCAKEDGYHYFELAEKIESKPYETKPISDSKAPRPLRQVLP